MNTYVGCTRTGNLFNLLTNQCNFTTYATDTDITSFIQHLQTSVLVYITGCIYRVVRVVIVVYMSCNSCTVVYTVAVYIPVLRFVIHNSICCIKLVISVSVT